MYKTNFITHTVKRSCALIGAGVALAALSQTSMAACTYAIESEWNTGFVANITIKNDTGAPINNWNVNWQYVNNRMASGWNANFSGSNPYSATNMAWNGSIAVGQSVTFGFQGNKNGAPAERPSVNGAACGGATTSSASSAPSSVPPSSSSVPSSMPGTSSSSSSSGGYTVPANNFAQNGGVENNLTNWGSLSLIHI